MIEFMFRPIDVWPGERTRDRKGSQFRSKWSQTLTLLKREMEHLRAVRPVIQIDLAERHFRVSDGLPKANAPRPDSPGVIISFDSRHGPLKYCCDTYTDWQDNVRAIAMTLENLRAVDRYGATTRRGEQYAGFRALPAPGNGDGFATAEDAAAFILKAAEFNGSPAAFLAASGDVRRSAYRAAAKKLHPDSGGNAQDFTKLQRAREILEATG